MLKQIHEHKSWTHLLPIDLNHEVKQPTWLWNYKKGVYTIRKKEQSDVYEWRFYDLMVYKTSGEDNTVSKL